MPLLSLDERGFLYYDIIVKSSFLSAEYNKEVRTMAKVELKQPVVAEISELLSGAKAAVRWTIEALRLRRIPLFAVS